MAAQHPSSRLPEITAVDSISIAQENLTWTRAEASEQASCNELLFVLKTATKHNQKPDFLLFFLQEEAENKEQPFQLSVLQVAEIPSEIHNRVITKLPDHFRAGIISGAGFTNEVDIVVSTKSGLGLAPRVWKDVLEPLFQLVAENESRETNNHDSTVDSSKSKHRVTFTESAGTVRDFAKGLWDSRSLNGRARTVLLLSGDGGVVDILNGSDGHDRPEDCPPTIALLPLGTGNALFHSLHKPLYSDLGATPLVHGLRTLFQGSSHDLPVFQASFSPGSRIVTFADKSTEAANNGIAAQKEETPISHLYGAVVASYGFHATVVYESDTPEYRVHGDKRFGMVAQELLRESHPYAAKVSIRRSGSTAFEDIPRETHAYVLAALVSNLERKFTISPETKPLQSQLRLVHFGPIGGERTMDVMMKAYDEGSHIGMEWADGERVGYDAVDETRVVVLEDDERWRKVCIDGTIVEIPKGGHMSVKLLDHTTIKILANPSITEEQA
ncbi:hypothetical protein FZEAL_6031 [Fusarium zealandicum]|uniref:DAGKc domain-containing protein n=1 Tax=Fusarium zealandicum TaxID=1053134 RepID=A0A8H4XKA1_9HYPO|nr:hypothetical protein FZEAL_6031 [Fusarium zealandicum]